MTRLSRWPAGWPVKRECCVASPAARPPWARSSLPGDPRMPASFSWSFFPTWASAISRLPCSPNDGRSECRARCWWRERVAVGNPCRSSRRHDRALPPRVLSLHPLRNIAASKTRYTADPKELIQTLVWFREQQREILAIYHSHPRWQAVPSATDLTQNYWGEMPRIIVSLLADPPDVRVWRLRPDSFQELPWKLIGPTGEPAGALQPTPPRD